MALCETLQISHAAYPFCRKTEAKSALRRHLIDLAKMIKGQEEQANYESNIRDIVTPVDILDQVEADGHEVDVRLVIEERDSYGQPVRYEILRIWLIVLIDVFSRCILGYSIALGRNYDQVDLLSAIYSSLAPHVRPPLCIPDTLYTAEGGFPSEGAGAWETWDTLKLDNAWAHRAKHVLTVLQDRIGCVAEFGRVHTPNDRPFIERFFLFLTQHFSHRIIGTTGNDSRDTIIKRLSPKSKNPVKMLISLDELRSAIDIVLSDYNGRPHSSLQGHTPLNIFRLRMSERALPANRLPEQYQQAGEFVMVREMVVVKSSSKFGGAYVNFLYLKYRNPEILRSDSAGRKMYVEYARNDISVIRLLDEAGSPLGMLMPPEPWCRHPHSFKLRTELCKAIKDGQLAFERNETVHQALRRAKLSSEGMSRSLATTLFKQSGRVSEEPAENTIMEREKGSEPTVKSPRLTKVYTY
jgi:transposase InsO family protein